MRLNVSHHSATSWPNAFVIQCRAGFKVAQHQFFPIVNVAPEKSQLVPSELKVIDSVTEQSMGFPVMVAVQMLSEDDLFG